MALIHHHTRNAGGEFERHECAYYQSPAEFVLAKIPDGVPFRCYKDGVDIAHDVDAMCEDGEFTIIEGAGGGIGKIFNFILKPIIKLFMPSSQSAPSVNQQAASANNSLTDRNNKPRPYERIFDICGTVQCIPSDLMQSYNIYDSSHKQYQYGYYYIGRGFYDTPESGVLDGDTQLSTITGSAACIYDPLTSPNNSAPRQIVGEDISESLYITTRSNSVDGLELKAPNEYQLKLKDVTISCQLSGTTGSLVDATGTMGFDDLFVAGDVISLSNVAISIYVPADGESPAFYYILRLDGTYTVISSSETTISFDVTNSLAKWQNIPDGSKNMAPNDNALISPGNLADVGFTDWFTISAIKSKRIIANIAAHQGMYKSPSDGGATRSNSASVELQWQLINDAGNPTGSITSITQALKDKSKDEVGMSVIVSLPTQSAVRVRVRRSTNQDTGYDGQSVDQLTFSDLYGQIPETTAHYGNITTIHTKRRNTPQATAVKEPQLKVLCTEKLFKYLGNGVFDSVRTNNTQAVQSLIRLMRDEVVGDLNMSTSSMDALLDKQGEIESYFGSALAGQFCYTFDDKDATAQDICQTIAGAIFCNVYREGQDIKLFFERPVQGPAMVFTNRSKLAGEKWTRSFGSDAKDSVEFTWVDPDTNVTETLKIPAEGGANANKIEGKGVRNYQQAYWLAHRARQKDLLQRESVEFTSTEEGNFVIVGEAISVVKGSRVASYDGYIVAQDGLTLTLSQEVEFTAGDDHYIQLKRRDGTVESIGVIAGANKRTVQMLSAPSEAIYTQNSAVKTEFSFGNEARHLAQMIVPTQVEPQSDRTVKITGSNYHPDVFLYDDVEPFEGAYSDGYSDGYAN